MNKYMCFIILFSNAYSLQARKKQQNEDVCCPGVSWTTKQECKADEGNFLQNDKCCENTYLGKKDSDDQVCCGACTEDALEPGVD